MDRLTLEVMAAHHPMRIVTDWEDDHWHVGCLMQHVADHNIALDYTKQIVKGPDAFPNTNSRSVRTACWACYQQAAEPWTD